MEHWCTVDLRDCVDNPSQEDLLYFQNLWLKIALSSFCTTFSREKLALEITKQNLPDHIKYLGEILETCHMVDLPPRRRQWGTKAQQCMLGSQAKRQFGANIPFPFSFFHIFHLATVLFFLFTLFSSHLLPLLLFPHPPVFSPWKANKLWIGCWSGSRSDWIKRMKSGVSLTMEMAFCHQRLAHHLL